MGPVVRQQKKTEFDEFSDPKHGNADPFGNDPVFGDDKSAQDDFLQDASTPESPRFPESKLAPSKRVQSEPSLSRNTRKPNLRSGRVGVSRKPPVARSPAALEPKKDNSHVEPISEPKSRNPPRGNSRRKPISRSTGRPQPRMKTKPEAVPEEDGLVSDAIVQENTLENQQSQLLKEPTQTVPPRRVNSSRSLRPTRGSAAMSRSVSANEVNKIKKKVDISENRKNKRPLPQKRRQSIPPMNAVKTPPPPESVEMENPPPTTPISPPQARGPT